MEYDFEATRNFWSPPPQRPTVRQMMVKEVQNGNGSLTQKIGVGVLTPKKPKAPSKGFPPAPKSIKYLCPKDNFVCLGKHPLSCPSTDREKKGHVSPTRRPLREGKICLEGCRYEIVRSMAKEIGFTEVKPTDAWNVMWTDAPVNLEKPLGTKHLTDVTQSLWRFPESPSVYQRANHFPGTVELCRKDSLSRNLGRMVLAFPEMFGFFPKTWHLPFDYRKLKVYCQNNTQTILICKPEAGSQGRGIFLTRNLNKIEETSKMVCQLYIRNPLLIDGMKFDLRIYVLITCYNPLRVYVYKEGLARFATMEYREPADDNMDLNFMHLTNYSVNKNSTKFVHEDSNGSSKRKMSTVLQHLMERGHNVIELVQEMDAIIIKTIMSAQPALSHYYDNTFPDYKNGCACFEVIGFDILLDTNLKPWLLEVNLSPSYVVDLPVDSEVKEPLIRDTLHMIHLGEDINLERESGQSGSPNTEDETQPKCPPGHRKSFGKKMTKQLDAQFMFETANNTNYRLIYPCNGSIKYREILQQPMDNLFTKSPALSVLERTRDRLERDRYSRK